MQSMPIYFDESGNTGSNHLDDSQPIYALSSLKLAPEQAEDLLQRHFGNLLAGGILDLKYARLSGSRLGRKAILSFLGEINDRPEMQKTYIVFKRFALVAKYVDWLVEPVAYADGIDMYENGGAMAKAFANMLWYMTPHAYPDGQWNVVMADFQNWSTGRLPTIKLRERVLSLRTEVGWERVDATAKIPFWSNHTVQAPGGQDYPMDISLTSAYSIVRSWMDDGNRGIEIVHDRSKVMEAQQNRWTELIDPELSTKLFAFTPGEWPALSINSVRFGDQYSDPALQLADIVAGANRDSANSLLGFSDTPFASLLRTELQLPRPYAGTIFPDPSIFEGKEGE